MNHSTRTRDNGHGVHAPVLGRRAFCLSAMGALGLAMGCGGRKTASRPNVILIVLDTVRADHVGYAGYTRRTTPHADLFAREATAYRRAYSTAPWTLPAHATLFTGLYSFQHGVEASLIQDAEGKNDVSEPPLPEEAVTLAETLRAAGYATAAFTANSAYMSMRFNFAQGFDSYDVQRRPGIAMVEPVAAWLRAHTGAPFFLFVNIMDAHYPYNTAPCPGAFDESVPQDSKTLVHQFLDAVLPGDKPVDARLVHDVTAQYDMGIANADRAAGQIIERLKQLGLYDNSLVIVTSDHGEFLGEHSLVQHSKDVYEEVLRVPLLVKAPGQRRGQWNEQPVSLIQLYGTMLETAAVARRSPLPGLDGNAPLLAELYYSRPWDITNPVWGKRFLRMRTAYYEWPWKLIHSSDAHHELYNINQDPKEAVNHFDDMRERAERMMSALAAVKPMSGSVKTPAGTPARELSEQDREALKANGYL